MNYKKISLFAIIGLVVVLLGGIVTVSIFNSKYNLSSFLTASLLTQPIQDQGSASFAVLAGSTITNTGSTVITGDVGLSPGTSITGFPPGTISGTQHITDAEAAQGQTDFTTAYNEAVGKTCIHDYSGTDLGTLTLTPGVYCFSSSAQLTGTLTLDGQGDPNAVFIFQIGSTLTTASNSVVSLIGSAQPCNIFWQVGTSATLGTSTAFKGNILALASATLNAGAGVDGRVWAQSGAVTLDTNIVAAATCAIPVNGTCGTAAKSYLYTDTVFSGTMCDLGDGITTPASPVFPSAGVPTTWICGGSNGGDASSTCTATIAGTPVNGTCGTSNGNSFSVAPDSNLCSAGSATSVTGTGPWVWTCAGLNGGTDSSTCTATVTVTTATLTLVKTIVGGARTFANFPLTATGPTTIIGNSATPAVTNATVTAGSYTLSEATQSDYAAGTWSCIKNTDPAVIGASITLASGDSAICTVQNVYITPAAPSGGGSYSIGTPVAPLIDVIKVPSPLALPAGPGLVKYTYTVSNIGTVPMTNVTVIDNSCSPLVLVSGGTSANAILQVNGRWTYTCSTTLSATHTNTVTATGWANGVSSIDIANATVVVGVSIVPPLIHVTKVPSPLALFAGGGMVNYTKKVTNLGTVALSNVQIVDDKCGSVKYVSGDANGDSKLDPTETWVYNCGTNLTKTTTNTVTVSGQANGLTARDFAIVTVIVAEPKLPNTGFAPAVK